MMTYIYTHFSAPSIFYIYIMNLSHTIHPYEFNFWKQKKPKIQWYSSI